MRAAVLGLVALTTVLATTGAVRGGERLDLGGARRLDDPLITAMDVASARSGMDGIVLVSIASIVEDGQAMRLSRTLAGGSAAGSALRSILDDNQRGGIYGFDDRAWLKTAPSLVSVARSDEGSASGRARPQGGLKRILALRSDPVFATEVAALALRDAIPRFRSAMGRDPSPGEMLDIHLFGVEAAAKLSRAALKDGRTPAAAVLGPIARRPALKIFLTSRDGRGLTARALVLSSEILMAVKARIANRYLGRLRA